MSISIGSVVVVLRHGSNEWERAVVVGDNCADPEWILLEYKTSQKREWTSKHPSSVPVVRLVSPIKNPTRLNLRVINQPSIRKYTYFRTPIKHLSSMFGLPPLLWCQKVFAYLGSTDINHFSQTCKTAKDVVDTSYSSRAAHTSYWNNKRTAVMKESMGPSKLTYEGPYTKGDGNPFHLVHLTRTVKFLMKLLNTNEICEVRFRRGRFLWRECAHTGTRLGQMNQQNAMWVDCRILKKTLHRSKKHHFSSQAYCCFESTPTAVTAREKPRCYVIRNQPVTTDLSTPDYQICGLQCCHSKDIEIKNMSVQTEYSLKRCIQCYIICAIRLDTIGTMKHFATSGVFLNLLPLSLLNIMPTETVGGESISGPPLPCIIKRDIYYPPPSPEAYRQALQRKKPFITCENRRWKECSLSELHWLGFY